ncbi:MAG: ATP-grasp domain-containing protein [Clostridiales bacterium]|nr:ATP-grasp domain-containing protein [Clostridiales bacterium]
MSYKIGLIYDRPHVEYKETEEAKHVDHQKEVTKDEIYKILNTKYNVEKILVDEKTIERLLKSEIDLAFLLTTGIRGESRQSQIPAILEMLGIPYIGSGVLAHALALNKAVAKKVFDYHDVTTPSFQIFYRVDEKLDSVMKFPLIAKPACEGSGFGIHKDSVVHNEMELKKKVESLLKEYEPPVLVEEFIEGREFTVGIIGNGKNKMILPIMELNFDDVPEKYGRFNTFEVKTKCGDETKVFCPAPITIELEKTMKENVLKAFDALGCRDISRVDIRVKDDKPYVIEINSLPGLEPLYSDLPKMAEKAGIAYDQLIFKIVDTAIERLKG